MGNAKLKTQKSKLKIKIQSFLIFLWLLTFNFQFSILNFVHADFPVAAYLEVADQEAGNGDIMTETADGIRRSTVPYDKSLLGVVIDTPTIAIHPESETTKAIISGGDNAVKVSSKNGDIKRGDFVTSSDLSGVGQKATQNGYVIGVALQDFPNEESTSDQGVISVSLNIHYNIVEGSAVGFGSLERIGQGFLNQLDNPGEFVRLSRYLLAALVAIIAILLSFFTFARSVRNGIEAMGRNPLARASIQRGMIINAFLTSVIALFGLVAAYLIIRFF